MKNKILYIQYTNPCGYPPLQHSSRMLAKAGWSVCFLGTRVLGTDALEFPPHECIQVRKLPFVEGGIRQKIHYLAYTLWVLVWCIFWRPRWVYASDPLSCLPGWLASWLPGLKVLYHEHDSPGPPANRFMRMISTFRKWLARKAELIVLPNERRCDRFAEQTGVPRNKVMCVWNCPSLEEVGWAGEMGDKGDFWLLYSGSINEDRLPLSVLEAMNFLPAHVKLRVVGYETVGSRGYVDKLRQRAGELGLIKRLEIVGPVSRCELSTYVRRSHLGLCLMPMQSVDVNMTCMTGASNKVFDYLACGLPVLVSDIPEWHGAYVDQGVALACNPLSHQTIADAINVFLDKPRKYKKMSELGQHKIFDAWNYEAQFQQVFNTVNFFK